MASITPSDDQTLMIRKPLMIQRRPLMLKDYLRDDFLGSCSSNGFKSFPRRQCCTTVRYLLEFDLKARCSPTTGAKRHRILRRTRSKAVASTTISALHRASQAVINAVKKQLPFHESVKSPSPPARNGPLKGLLPRSLSRKLFSRKSFWRKAENKESDIGRCTLCREIPNERDKPSDQAAHHSRASTSTSSHSESWTESEFFTSEILRSSSGNSVSSSENDVLEGKTDLPDKKVVGQTVGDDSIVAATTSTCSGASIKEWPNEEGKEQLSPVSVLDCPFEDDEEISSPFHSKLAHIEGTKKKLQHKILRFECLAQLEPVDLEKRIALSELNYEAPPQSPMQPCSMSSNTTEQKAQEFLDLVKTKSSPVHGSKFTAENMLLDFFRERVEDNGIFELHDELLKAAEDWLCGNSHQELFLRWEFEDARKVYVRDMEKGGKWRTLVEDKEEVALDMELQVWTSLLNELLDDLF